MTTKTKPEALTYGALVIDEPTEYVSHHYETASAYDRLILQPGRYPFRLVNLNYTPWVMGARNMESSMPTGPYYAIADVNAILVEHYYENRLLTEVRAETKVLNETITHRVQMYAYEIDKRKSWGTAGRIEAESNFRFDTYACIRELSLDNYHRVLVAAIEWLGKNGHGDYSDSPAWHTWNRVNARALGGIDGFVKAVMEGYAR
jgi:hypothetical protein